MSAGNESGPKDPYKSGIDRLRSGDPNLTEDEAMAVLGESTTEEQVNKDLYTNNKDPEKTANALEELADAMEDAYFGEVEDEGEQNPGPVMH